MDESQQNNKMFYPTHKIMSKLPLTIALLLFLLTTILNHSSLARNLGNQTPKSHQKISFLMRNVLNETHPSSRPATTKVTSQIPFAKPLGLFPSINGIPNPDNSQRIPFTGSSTQTLELSGVGIAFPTRATLEELEFGVVTEIEEIIYQSSEVGMQATGRAQGVYVASSEDGSSHMMAMTIGFGHGKNLIRFFGVHRIDTSESHIAVIGGTGKYLGANGYATVKSLDLGSKNDAEEIDRASKKLLLFDTYLS